MLLTLGERFVTLSVLPKQSDITTLRILHDLRASLAPTETEISEFEIRPISGDQGVRWNLEKLKNGDGHERTFDIDIGPKAASLICEELEKLNSDKKLTEQHLSIYEKFVS